jgi:hypothetical protein
MDEQLNQPTPEVADTSETVGEEVIHDSSGAPEETVSDETVSDETVSDETVSDETVSDETVSVEPVSVEPVLVEAVLVETASGQTVQPILSAASALVGDPAKFGRVAEDGTVFVITPEGEKPVGSYPGKTAEEALGYFVRKFESLASEVALLADRIKIGALVPEDAALAVSKLKDQIKNLNGVGDLATLAKAVEQIPSLIEEHKEVYETRKASEDAIKAEKRKEAFELKEKIVTEAESLELSDSWKSTGDRLKTLLEEWKSISRIDKHSDAELWKRFSHARNSFDKRRRTHFAELEAQSAVVAQSKIAIVEEAKTLANSREWLATANRFKELMETWKAAGRGRKNVDTKLWQEFKAAQDEFFTAKKADLEKRQESMVVNLAKREELIVQIEALLPVTDVAVARRNFRELLEMWDRIGMTERSKRASLEDRLKKVQNEIDDLHEEVARRSDPTAIAHANKVVQSLMEAIDSYEKQAAKAEAAGFADKAAVARAAVEARRTWLIEAQKGLTEFTPN